MIHCRRRNSTGGMDLRVRVFFLFVLGASLVCDARELLNSEISDTQISYLDLEREVSKKDNMCTLCEEFASEALEYLAANKTQIEIIDTLHMSCSRLPSFKQQCITLVDYYAPLFFLEMTAVDPKAFCKKVNLCEQIVTISTQNRDNSCDFCHQTISELMDKLKDPDTQLEIIELLLKACNSVENYAKKCKRFVFEYGPLIITNAEKFLESTDICTALPACSSPGIEGLADS